MWISTQYATPENSFPQNFQYNLSNIIYVINDETSTVMRHTIMPLFASIITEHQLKDLMSLKYFNWLLSHKKLVLQFFSCAMKEILKKLYEHFRSRGLDQPHEI